MTEQHDSEELEERRPLGLNLLTGLYAFFFLLTFSTVGHPLPFMGRIYTGSVAQTLVFIDSLFCLYLVIGLVKRQYLTWFLLIGYNLFEIGNTIVNLTAITPAELEKFAGESINQEALLINNIIVALTILLLTQFIYRHKAYFTNRRLLLF
jgi:hypothetical protein